MVQPLVSKRLERVSKDLFKQYHIEITEIVEEISGCLRFMRRRVRDRRQHD